MIKYRYFSNHCLREFRGSYPLSFTTVTQHSLWLQLMLWLCCDWRGLTRGKKKRGQFNNLGSYLRTCESIFYSKTLLKRLNWVMTFLLWLKIIAIIFLCFHFNYPFLREYILKIWCPFGIGWVGPASHGEATNTSIVD